MNCAEKLLEPTIFFNLYIKVSKGEKIRNRYDQVPHLTKSPNNSGSESPWRKRYLSLNLEFRYQIVVSPKI